VHRGPAQDLHDLQLPDRRIVAALEVDRPALVLGSTQPIEAVDPVALEAAGVDLARRRSGGGAVLLLPGEHVWVDVVVPAGDLLWDDDVEVASWWLGDAWAAALAAAPSAPRSAGAPVVGGGLVPEVHRRGLSDRRLGRIVCFAASGPGEVAVGGRKLVGISQRRTRRAARFQCILHRRFDPAATTSLLGADLRSVEMGAALDGGVTDLRSLGVDPGWSVVEGLRSQLA
jgi:lipoate-protein ligase A